MGEIFRAETQRAQRMRNAELGEYGGNISRRDAKSEEDEESRSP
jgi:hypothetical protein